MLSKLKFFPAPHNHRVSFVAFSNPVTKTCETFVSAIDKKCDVTVEWQSLCNRVREKKTWGLKKNEGKDRRMFVSSENAFPRIFSAKPTWNRKSMSAWGLKRDWKQIRWNAPHDVFPGVYFWASWSRPLRNTCLADACVACPLVQFYIHRHILSHGHDIRIRKVVYIICIRMYIL